MSTLDIAPPAEPPTPTRRVPRFAVRSSSSVDAWARRLFVPLLIVLQVLMWSTLHNTPADDEALYIQAGRELIAHWETGASVIPFGSFFSGAPAAYPVLAAFLDGVGGLWLVRAFSLACMVGTMLCVRATTRYLFDRKSGDLAAFAFAVTGPVVFLGALATFDAICMFLLSLGLWLGVTRTSYVSATLAGLALAAAAVVKYTGAAFIPVVLGVALVACHSQMHKKQLLRVLTAAAVTTATLVLLYARWGESVHDGIFFTTTGREALSPAPLWLLMSYVVKDIGLLIALAVYGGFFVARSLRSTVLLLGIFAGASGLVASQMYLGEAMSFEKHTAFSALFLAPLAGRALTSLTWVGSSRILFITLMGALLASGLVRAHAMHNQWPNLERVVPIVERFVAENPQPGGAYFSTQASQFEYFTYDEDPQNEWQAHYSIYDSTPEGIRQLVEDQAFEMLVWRTKATGNPAEEAMMDVLQETVHASPHYELVVEPFPVREGMPDDDWYIFKLKNG